MALVPTWAESLSDKFPMFMRTWPIIKRYYFQQCDIYIMEKRAAKTAKELEWDKK